MTEEELLSHFKKSVELKLRPQFLYQYRPINTNLLKSIKTGQIFFSNPLDFNDPFECRFAEIRVSDSDLKSYLRFLKKVGLYENHIENSDPSREPREQIISAFFSSIKEMGISCFTTKNNNGLMWSHYANSHNGVCLEFDTLEDVTFFEELYKVKYVFKRWAYNYLKDPLKTHDFFTRKSAIWKYEDEYRVIKIRKGLHPFNKKALKKIIFGCNTSQRARSTVLNCLKKNGYECHPFYVCPSGVNYDLEIIAL